MQLFFSQNISGEKIFLDEEESKHCAKVLRKKAGDAIEVIDGKGNYYRAAVSLADFRKTEAIIQERFSNWNVPDYKLSIAIAPTKNAERFEWFCEKACEIGVYRIIPLLTARTERNTIKPERIRKIFISAVKQSGKALLPELKDAFTFNELINISSETHAQKFIAWCETNREQHLKKRYKPGKDSLLLIGPEGDFTPAETALAQSNGFETVSLGNNRLRTETAGVFACSMVNLLEFGL